ncbi:carbohydrate porin [Haloferula sp.]|uniref:carbohydrate porin n=1 Tax=Haloferula sp. TaxID=2497595 RepID=UPI00329AF82D
MSEAMGEDQESSDEDFIGGPSSVGSQLQSDSRPAGEEGAHPWEDFKGKIREQSGLDFNFDYTTLYQNAGASLNGNDEGFSGVFRLYGKWELIGRGTANKGSLIAKVENRHKLGGDVVPNALGPNLGYLGTTGASFNDAGWFLSPLYWEQFLADGRVEFVVGRVDSLDFVDISGYSGQWLRFQNGSLLVNSTIPYPDLGLGGGGGFKIGDDWWVGASIHDANGAGDEFEFLVDGSEFFKQAFVSWSPNRTQRMDRAAHFTVWHADERTGAGIDDGWGLAVSGNWLFDNGVMPFVRAGWAEGSAARADATVIAGMLYRFSNGLGELGAALGWESLSGSGLGNQKAAEFFFRWDVTPSFALTPSIQVLLDPALNPSDDTIVLGGLRARLNF